MRMNVKKIVSTMLSLVLVFGISGCGTSGDTTMNNEDTNSESSSSEVNGSNNSVDYNEPLPTDYTGTLTMWGWDDPYFNAVTEAFNEKYPNVKFVYTPMANGDTLQKYQTALATGTELPDVAWSIIDSRAKVFELDMWEDLSQAPYNFDINDVYESVHSRMINSKGAVNGIEQCLVPAGFAYRKDLAKEYFGTDDPIELEAMFPDWESFIEAGTEVYDKSNGSVHMMAGVADAQQFIREQGGKSWIEGDTINATSALKDSIDLSVQFRDNNTADNLEAWSAPWYASFGEGKWIFAGCATWSIPSTIEPNDPEGEKSGHWGLMNAPGGDIIWGGTTLGITKSSKDKRLAWEFIKFATLSTEGAQALQKIAFFTSAKQPYIDAPELLEYKSEWFGEQDLGDKFLNDIQENTTLRPMNKDDNIIHNVLNTVNTTIKNDNSITADKAMELLKEELKLQLPEYTVE